MAHQRNAVWDGGDGVRPTLEADATETTPLLAAVVTPTFEVPANGAEKIIELSDVRTTWQQETRTIVCSALPLIVTFVLQYLINISGIFAVGRIGALELGAASLAVMTGNVTCNLLIQGLATGLDTLCAQAYGSGQKHLVGLHLQRMVLFILPCLGPLMLVWWHSDNILIHLVPNAQSAQLAGLYLKVMILGSPGFVLFECGKRFVQAQGLFHVTTYVLLIAAPFNAFVMWLFVWYLGWGYIGAPIAVALTQNLMAFLLFLYVWLVDGSECWGGFTKSAFTNWGPMIRLSLPSMVMLVAEFFASEILTLASSHFGTPELAAESCLVTIACSLYFITFPVSVAASTRVANLIGAGSSKAAKTSAKTAIVIALILATPVVMVVSLTMDKIPYLFTQDEVVAKLVTKVLPIIAAQHVFDAMAALSQGLLRGIGWQEFGGYASIIVYYFVALPISFGTGFGLHWELTGLWTGIASALFLLSAVEFWWLYRSDWDLAVDAATRRNQEG